MCQRNIDGGVDAKYVSPNFQIKKILDGNHWYW